ncbi:MAG: hypothetical protein IT286_02620 [Proteobacteria bacterium]|jgi:hypothetical protein|nr:hypothetical protein [Pseudomonadota bacterium]
MKKILFVMLSAIAIGTPSFAQDAQDEKPSFQVGGDFVVPWNYTGPNTRQGMQAGGHIQAYLNESVTFDVTALFGVENKPGNEPIFLNPGLSVYLPTYIVQPYLSAALPLLLNNGKDIGLQGSAGFQFGLPRGLALRYSVDTAYYFDADVWVVNWVHAGVALNF